MVRVPRSLDDLRRGAAWRRARWRPAMRGAAIRYWWARRSILPVAGIWIKTGSHLSFAVLESIYGEYYERPELKIVRAILEPDDLVLELDTGIGFSATACATRIGSGRVFTYEANQAMEPHIRDTFALNRVAPNLTIALVGRQVAEATLYIDEKNVWASSTVRRAPESRPVRVPTLGLSDEIRRIRPTFLIVDIEGSEADLFEGIELGNVRKMSIEVHRRIIGAEAVARLKALVESAGFRLRPGLSTGGVWFLERCRDAPDGRGQ